MEGGANEADQQDSGGGGGGGERLRGVAARWNERGFGFIVPNDGSDDLFCHANDITDGNCLVEGAGPSLYLACSPLVALVLSALRWCCAEVEYEKVYDDRRGKYNAKEVTGGANEGDEPGGFGGGGGRGSQFGPTGHDYRRDDDGTTQVDEDKINGMLADRLQAKMSRDFPTADRIRDDLRAMGIEVYDQEKTWRASGGGGGGGGGGHGGDHFSRDRDRGGAAGGGGWCVVATLCDRRHCSADATQSLAGAPSQRLPAVGVVTRVLAAHAVIQRRRAPQVGEVAMGPMISLAMVVATEMRGVESQHQDMSRWLLHKVRGLRQRRPRRRRLGRLPRI